MIRGLGAALSILALLGFTAASAAEGAGAETRSHGLRTPTASAKFVPGEVVVRFEPGVAASGRAAVLDQTGARRKQRLLLPRAELLELPKGLAVGAAVRALEAKPEVSYAEPNWIYRAQLTPNDPRYSALWGLNQASDADIDAPEAWDQTTGTTAVKVAVVDTGVASDHPDLAPNIWTNPADPAGGGDEDGNGFVDDIHGWDFVQNDNDPRDLNGHGTHVAGTIGARGDNGTGVTGVNWQVTLIPVRVLGADGSGTLAQVADGLDYAGDVGARVVNASLGADGGAQVLKDAIDSHPNTLYVVAAGNGGDDGVGDNNDFSPQYPCNYTSLNLVCVAATTETDSLAEFSNYGASSVDLAAPGTEIVSTWPAYDSAFTDGFESAGIWTPGGAPNTWDRTTESFASGTRSGTDSPGANYVPNTDNWLRTTNPISLAGRQGCQVRYWLKLQTEWPYDGFAVSGSTNGSFFTDVAAWSGETIDFDANRYWLFEESLTQFDGASTFYLRFGLRSDEIEDYDGAHVDDVDVRCIGATYDSNDYEAISGTSMATPHVAGVAALVWARNPAATVAGVRGALLTTVDHVAGLGGMLASGGRLNAARAVQAAFAPPPPPPDNVPPTLTVQSTSPSLNNWSNVNAAVATWSGATDVSGIDGYSFAWSPDAGFVPDQVKDVEENVTSSSATLADGRHWFHIRARDGAGNWSNAVHFGPFLVDTYPSAKPTLSSPTHRVGVASANRTVEINWISLGDSVSGLDGFSFAWSRQQLVPVDQTKDAEEGVVRTTSPRLDPGAWWFGIRARDNAGNWTEPTFLGPFIITGVTPVCTVPRLRGLTLLGAKRSLVRRGCALGRVTKAYSRRVRRGRVVGQRPAPGLRLRRGAKVAVVVSRGRRKR